MDKRNTERPGGVREQIARRDAAVMPKTARKRRSRDATLCGMDDKNFPSQAHMPAPETCQERIARIQAAAAVQIARAAAGQPTGWTVLNVAVHWVLKRLDVLLEQAS